MGVYVLMFVYDHMGGTMMTECLLGVQTCSTCRRNLRLCRFPALPCVPFTCHLQSMVCCVSLLGWQRGTLVPE